MTDYNKSTDSEFNLPMHEDFVIGNYLESMGFELVKDNDSTAEYKRKVFYQEIKKVVDVNIFVHHNIIYNMFSSLALSVFADGERIYKGLIPQSESSMSVLMSLLFPSMETVSKIENIIIQKEREKSNL